jgi:hypothetical protein
MKRILSALLLSSALLMLACNKPKEVPDKILGAIFHDAMLVNAYLTYNPGFSIDSLNIYEPIFARYGYTTEDVHYTINSFSRRKSIHLSDVAEYMIDLLDQESQSLRERVARQDTIDNVASRRFSRVVYSDKDIVIDRDADSSRLRIVVPAIEPGYYKVNGSYTLDSLDREPNRRMRIYFEHRDQSEKELLNGTLQRRKAATFNQQYYLAPDDSITTSFVVDLFHYSREPKRRKMPRMVIHNVEITHTPLTERSVDMLFNEQSHMRIFSDSLIRAIEAQANK